MATIRANANPELLAWARKSLGMDIAEAARKIGGKNFNQDHIEAWENGEAQPTVKQLRKIAKVYKRPLATFFLSEFPTDFTIPRDFRRLPGDGLFELSSALRTQLKRAEERRELALELYDELGEQAPEFPIQATLDEDPEVLGGRIREALGVTLAEQAGWRDRQRYKALNQWRSRMEEMGVLVFQFSEVETQEALGFSVAAETVPVIAVNRKLRLNGRIFTMLHEFVHLALRQSGLCDIDENLNRRPEEQRIEIFCNKVAAAALVPAENILAEAVVTARPAQAQDWDDDTVNLLAEKYSVSREVIVRKLLTLGRTTEAFYRRKRGEYQRQLEAALRQQRPGSGFESPAVKVVSIDGQGFVKLVLECYHHGNITLSDASSYLGVRIKHLPTIEQRLLPV